MIKGVVINDKVEVRELKFRRLLGDLERNSAFNNNFNETMILKKLNELFEEVVNDEDTWIRMKEKESQKVPLNSTQVSQEGPSFQDKMKFFMRRILSGEYSMEKSFSSSS